MLYKLLFMYLLIVGPDLALASYSSQAKGNTAARAKWAAPPAMGAPKSTRHITSCFSCDSKSYKDQQKSTPNSSTGRTKPSTPQLATLAAHAQAVAQSVGAAVAQFQAYLGSVPAPYLPGVIIDYIFVPAVLILYFVKLVYEKHPLKSTVAFLLQSYLELTMGNMVTTFITHNESVYHSTDQCHYHDDEVVTLILGFVLSSLCFLVLLMRMERRMRAHATLLGQESSKVPTDRSSDSKHEETAAPAAATSNPQPLITSQTQCPSLDAGSAPTAAAATANNQTPVTTDSEYPGVGAVHVPVPVTTAATATPQEPVQSDAAAVWRQFRLLQLMAGKPQHMTMLLTFAAAVQGESRAAAAKEMRDAVDACRQDILRGVQAADRARFEAECAFDCAEYCLNQAKESWSGVLRYEGAFRRYVETLEAYDAAANCYTQGTQGYIEALDIYKKSSDLYGKAAFRGCRLVNWYRAMHLCHLRAVRRDSSIGARWEAFLVANPLEREFRSLGYDTDSWRSING